MRVWADPGPASDPATKRAAKIGKSIEETRGDFIQAMDSSYHEPSRLLRIMESQK